MLIIAGVLVAVVSGSKVVHAPVVIAKEMSLYDKLVGRTGERGGQCVEFIQRYFESYYTHPKFRGEARDISPNATEPKIGGVVLTNEGKLGHAAIIVGIEGDELILAESNYTKNLELIDVGRRLSIDNERIRGYFNF